ncbi:MAG: EamA family transporter [bacterium]|nr:EamA family transporter [bacterium]
MKQEMGLVLTVVLATIFYSLFEIFASRAGKHIDANLSSVFFNGVGALLPLVVYSYLRARDSIGIATTRSGVLFSLLAGISIAIFSVLLIKAFEKGGLSYIIPVIYGGSILISSLAGWLIYKEHIGVVGGVGVLVILVGIVLVVVSKFQS